MAARLLAAYFIFVFMSFISQKSGNSDASIVDGTCKSRVLIYNYPCQEYTVNTNDGYILTMQRIPNGISGGNDAADREPVLLQHGLFMDGAIWVLNQPDQSLAFILADNGFDVWIANNRGTKCSRQHEFLAPNDTNYWKWTWDELAAYDLPASVDFVYKKTGKKINFIGHSQGALIALAAFSQGKLLNNLKSAALLAPVATLNHVTSFLVKARADSLLQNISAALQVAEFDPLEPELIYFLRKICSNPKDFNLCLSLIALFTGENCCLNASNAILLFEYEPHPTSFQNMVHLAQMVKNGKMAMYDYQNMNLNMEHYNQTQPPNYDLSKIPMWLPLFVSHGGKDALADYVDVKILLNKLKHDDINVLYLEDYAHADFVMAISANHQLYQPLIEFLSKS